MQQTHIYMYIFICIYTHKYVNFNSWNIFEDIFVGNNKNQWISIEIALYRTRAQISTLIIKSDT